MPCYTYKMARCPSVIHRVTAHIRTINDWTNRAGFGTEPLKAWRLPSTCPALCDKEIRVSPNVRELCPNSELRKFRHGKSIVLSTKLVDGRACWSHLRRSMRCDWTHIICYTSVDRNAPTPLLWFVVHYNLLFVQLFGRISTETALLAVCLH